MHGGRGYRWSVIHQGQRTALVPGTAWHAWMSAVALGGGSDDETSGAAVGGQALGGRRQQPYVVAAALVPCLLASIQALVVLVSRIYFSIPIGGLSAATPAQRKVVAGRPDGLCNFQL